MPNGAACPTLEELLVEDFAAGASAVLSSAGAVASREARTVILTGLREAQRDASASAFYATDKNPASRDLHFALRPQILSDEEVSELEAFRAKRSAAQGMRFRRIPTIE